MSQLGLICKPHNHGNHEILDIKSCKIQFCWASFGGMGWNLGKSKYWRAKGWPYRHKRVLEKLPWEIICSLGSCRPLERNEVIHLTRRAIKYYLVDGVLYRQFVLTLLFKCLSPGESSYILRESMMESTVYTSALDLLSLKSLG